MVGTVFVTGAVVSAGAAVAEAVVRAAEAVVAGGLVFVESPQAPRIILRKLITPTKQATIRLILHLPLIVPSNIPAIIPNLGLLLPA